MNQQNENQMERTTTKPSFQDHLLPKNDPIKYGPSAVAKEL